jgi:hypothetical protein
MHANSKSKIREGKSGPRSYLIEHLCQLGERTFDLSDVLMSFLDFPICGAGLSITRGRRKLQSSLSKQLKMKNAARTA